jgi:hypothetical protein
MHLTDLLAGADLDGVIPPPSLPSLYFKTGAVAGFFHA